MAATEFGTPVSNVAAATNTVSVNHTLGAGNGNRIAIISVMMDDGSTTPDVSALTYGGVAATMGSEIQNVVEDSYAGVWYVLEDDLPADGVTAVVLTSTVVSTNTLYIYVTTIQDANQDVPEDTGSEAPDHTSATFELVTTDGSYQHDAAVNGFTGVLTWGVDQVEQLDVTVNNQRWGVSNKEQGTGGTDTWVVNGSDDNWSYAGASFAEQGDITITPTTLDSTAVGVAPTLLVTAIPSPLNSTAVGVAPTTLVTVLVSALNSLAVGNSVIVKYIRLLLAKMKTTGFYAIAKTVSMKAKKKTLGFYARRKK